MRPIILAVTGLAVGVIACSSSMSPAAQTPVKSIAVVVPSHLVTGQTDHAVATPLDENGAALTNRAVTWRSSQPAIADVTPSGSIEAVAPGSAMITASSEGVEAQSSLTVTDAPAPPPPAPAPVASVVVDVNPSALLVGATVRATASTRDASGAVLTGRAIAWQSSNTGVATVSSTGDVLARAAGSSTISATSEGISGSVAVSVSAAPPPAPAPVASVTVTPASPSVQVGQTQQLTATLRDANGAVLTGRTIAWSSSNAGVASVNASGLATALAAGSAAITATSGGVAGSTSLAVTAPPPPAAVASVTVAPASPSVQVGQTQQFSATLRDASGAVLTGRTIAWTSSNGSVATVNGSGLATALAVGSSTITATSGGVAGSGSLNVTAPPPPPPQGGAAPQPAAGDVIRISDDFDRSPVSAQLSGYATRGVMQTVAGRSGNALRFVYTGSSYDNLIEKNFAETRNMYVRYWYRLSPGADPTCGDRGGSGMKWFMAWRTSGPRYTNGVGNLSNGPTGRNNRGNEFSTHDNSSVQQPNPFLSNVNNNIRFSTTNDGQWHSYTLQIVTGTGGYEKIWIDGTLILDNSSFGYDHAAEGIGMIQFPGTLVSWFSGCDFTIDVDDLVVWTR